MNRIRTLVLTVLLVGPGMAVYGQDIPIQLLPQPRQIERLDENYILDLNATVSYPQRDDDAYMRTADLLRTRLNELAKSGLTLKPARSRSADIVLGLIGQDDDVTELVHALPQDRQPQTDEGYYLEVTPKRILLAGNSGAGLFYAAQTMLQLVREADDGTLIFPGVRISDWPESAFRGVMIDSSQGTLPNVANVKRILTTLGEYKLNRYYLYSEDTLEYPNQPLVGEPGGRYTPDDIREIVAEGEKHYVTVTPCVQFHGHLHNVLRMERYSDMAEVPHGGELSPGQDGVDEFIESCVQNLVELYHSDSIHVGGDETYELGSGRSRERFPGRSPGELYLEHAHHVHDIIRKYGKTPEVWGDILLNHPETIDKIPKDTRMMTWSYFERDDFTPLVKPFAEAGLPFVVCPGVRNWMQVYPNFKGMQTVVDQFLVAGRKYGTDGLLNTLWIDICDELYSMNYYGFAYGAAAGWESNAPDREAFDRNFAWTFHRDAGGSIMNAYKEILAAQVVAESINGSSIRLFWLNPFEEKTQKSIVEWESKLREMRLHAENALEALYQAKQQPLRNKDVLDYTDFAALRLDFTGLKLQYGPEMSRIYHAARASGNEHQIWVAGIQLGASTKANKCRVFDLIYMLGNLKARYRELWLRDNSPYNLEGTLALWDREIQRYWDMYDEINRAWDGYRKTKALPDPNALGFYVE